MLGLGGSCEQRIAILWYVMSHLINIVRFEYDLGLECSVNL